MRSYTRPEVVGLNDGAVEGHVRGLGVLDPPASAPALVVAPAPMEPLALVRVTVGKPV